MSDTLPNKYDDMTDAEIIKVRDKMMNNLVVVLNDGETYTSLSGCVILQVPQEVWNVPDDIDYWIKEHSSEGKPISDLLNNA
jgi:hypothetical protein